MASALLFVGLADKEADLMPRLEEGMDRRKGEMGGAHENEFRQSVVP